MLGILAGFRKIGICILQHGILIAMPELFLQADIPWHLVIFRFCGTLRGILIESVWHDSTSYMKGRETVDDELRATPARSVYPWSFPKKTVIK